VNLRLDREEIGLGETARVRVDVTNTGSRRGDEVVQLYIRDVVSSVTRPVKELKGFRRVSLDAGATTTVAFDVTPEHLSFYDIDMVFRVEPGEFRLMVGPSSRDEDLQTLTLRVKAAGRAGRVSPPGRARRGRRQRG
jgi:beta-glucosidase